MRLGKLTNIQLEELILKKFTFRRPEVVLSPRVGVDCAAVDMGGRLAVLSTDPITAAQKDLGRLTVHVSCNDAAAAGAEPVGLLVTLLVPPSASEEDIGRVADELKEASELANIEIIGGHTEVTDAVNRMVTCATVLAKAPETGLVTSGGMKAGNDIVLTKHAGLEGAAVIANDRADTLKLVTQAELDTARGFVERLSVVREGLFAASHGATAMHDVTEGGVLGAVWEMAEASGCGAKINKDAVCVHPVTRKLCDELGIDVLRLLSSGCMLIACIDGKALVEGLEGIGVEASVIGCAQSGREITLDGEPVLPPEADELYRLF